MPPFVPSADAAQLLHRPRQVAEDEAASSAPERFAFRQTANVAQAVGHDAAGGGRNINANPLAFQISGHVPFFSKNSCPSRPTTFKPSLIFSARMNFSLSLL